MKSKCYTKVFSLWMSHKIKVIIKFTLKVYSDVNCLSYCFSNLSTSGHRSIIQNIWVGLNVWANWVWLNSVPLIEALKSTNTFSDVVWANLHISSFFLQSLISLNVLSTKPAPEIGLNITEFNVNSPATVPVTTKHVELIFTVKFNRLKYL